MPLGFGPPFMVALRLFHPYSTEDKTPRLMVKELFTARNTERFIEKRREEGGGRQR